MSRRILLLHTPKRNVHTNFQVLCVVKPVAIYDMVGTLGYNPKKMQPEWGNLGLSEGRGLGAGGVIE